ncbi:hypothetical protein GUITHDRAFT_144947 [Guillardia theta CCMP2712]|uniref:Fibronectin type-II domain-containing protein n=1 Tax=Guillardia theta (strain CCMP2712) TaxID=905079 RepID=L1IMN7_GUITC|nr:hypothetical protein GUITHDRAFT_144947 [Guillardia theta CCMP2712]EKX37521.1 hypothetical protein GUITHDRAFT_144947 [Guillardia theta CCMP2712]|eukprot:XP_005824501.1 hypothetical protein GUITHDRAFT_144947 [Guillardia theta CCMP2712]
MIESKAPLCLQVKEVLSNGLDQQLRDLLKKEDARDIRGCSDFLGAGSLLHYAATTGKLRNLEALVTELGLNVNQTDTLGMTPLHIASMRGNVQFCISLMRLGASITARDHQRRSARDLAILSGHRYLAGLLLNGLSGLAVGRESKSESAKSGRQRNSSSSSVDLRSHLPTAGDHILGVCASPAQQTTAENCMKLYNFTHAGGIQANCTAVPDVPDCIKNGYACLNGEVLIPEAPCAFPFEYKGKLYYQCFPDAVPWCYMAPNFQVPCSPEAKLAGCNDDINLYNPNLPKYKCRCNIVGSWNAPTASSRSMTIIGYGFGNGDRDCTTAYMDCIQAKTSDECRLQYFPNASSDNYEFPQNCKYHVLTIGKTQVSNVNWTSDSSISCSVPPGIGINLGMNLVAGRYRRDTNAYSPLINIFSYDRPAERQVMVPNSPTSGDRMVTILGQNFAPFMVSAAAAIGETDCQWTRWVSSTSMFCSVPVGTGGNLPVNVSIYECQDTALEACTPTLIMSKGGVKNVFSYDKPSITSVGPGNSPAVGYALITIFGKNFGYSNSKWTLLDSSTGTTVQVATTVQSYALSRFPMNDYYIDLHLATSEPNRALTAGLEFICVGDATYDGTPCYCPNGASTCASALCGTFAQCTAARFLCVGSSKDNFAVCANSNAVCAGGSKCVAIPLGLGCQYWEKVCTVDKDVYGCVPPFLKFSCEFSLNPDGINCNKVSQSPTTQSVNSVLCASNFHGYVTGTECINLIWLSDSSIICRVPAGLGPQQDVSLMIDGQSRSLSQIFTYNAPELSSIPTSLQPTSGKAVMTFFGESFGAFSCNRTWCSRFQISGDVMSHKSSNGGSACMKTSWNSDSTLLCQLSAGVGADKEVQVTVMSSANTLSSVLLEAAARSGKLPGRIQYQPPELNVVLPGNGPTKGSSFVQLTGKSFGYFDSSVAARMVGSACSATRWMADTAVLCSLPGGISSAECSVFAQVPAAECYSTVCGGPQSITNAICRTVALTVQQQLGSEVGAFSFDQPAMQFVKPINSPTTGSVNMTLVGSNFGTQPSYGHQVWAASKKCKSTTFVSDSSLICETPQSVGTGHKVYATLLAKGGEDFYLRTADSSRSLFSYDRPVIAAYQPPHVPTTGGSTITALGSGFGAERCGGDCTKYEIPQLTVGDTACYTTTWVSDSSLLCSFGVYPDPGPGVGQNLPAGIVVGSQASDLKSFFSYNAPAVMGFTTGNPPWSKAVPYASNGPAEGDRPLTIFGSNFGVLDYSPTATIGETSCKRASWTSDTSILCTTPACTNYLAGANYDLPLQVEVGLAYYTDGKQLGVKIAAFTCDFPIPVFFKLNNNEINLLSFLASLLLAGLVVCCLHRRYKKEWPSIPLTLPKARARYPPGQKPNPKQLVYHTLWTKQRDDDDAHSASSQDDDEEEEDPKKRADILQNAFEKGLAAATKLAGGPKLDKEEEEEEDEDQEEDVYEDEGFKLHSRQTYRPPRVALDRLEKANTFRWGAESTSMGDIPESIQTPQPGTKQRQHKRNKSRKEHATQLWRRMSIALLASREGGGRRQEAGGRRQEAEGRRQEEEKAELDDVLLEEHEEER